MYVDKFNYLATWEQRDLLWRQVIGFVQRYLPACYAQAYANGQWAMVRNIYPLVRSFDFKYVSGALLPLRVDSGLGFDWAVSDHEGPYRRGGWGLWWGFWCEGMHRLFDLQNYVKQKHQPFKNYSRPTQRCVPNVRP